jgi:CheY-like chemotaxis protein
MEKRKVMIVDDEEHFLKITKINLENTGKYNIETMSDARDIISRVKSFNPDVILLDILMPKMDGVEVCKMLNEDPAGGRIPIITLSALDTDKDRLTMYKLGVVDFLIKPIEKDELIAKIEKALQCK